MLHRRAGVFRTVGNIVCKKHDLDAHRGDDDTRVDDQRFKVSPVVLFELLSVSVHPLNDFHRQPPRYFRTLSRFQHANVGEAHLRKACRHDVIRVDIRNEHDGFAIHALERCDVEMIFVDVGYEAMRDSLQVSFGVAQRWVRAPTSIEDSIREPGIA